MKNLIVAGLMMLTMGMAALAEPVEKNATNQPAPAPIVTGSTVTAPAQPEVKKDQTADTKTEQAPVKPRKPVELNFRNF